MARAQRIDPEIREEQESPLITDPVEAAQSAGLRYYTDARPGIQRKRAGEHFSYINTDGSIIRDAKVLDRVKKLGIPPAWSHVWICPSPKGHIQATGRDAKGRKQYRYHEHWREVRDETKYTRMLAFGEALPLIRERTDVDLAQRNITRERVLATVVQLLDKTAIRIGNEEYARDNNSFGLTTLRQDHVDVEGSKVHFHFRGKSGKEHRVDVKSTLLAHAVRRLEDLPGHELFQYVDPEGELQPIDSADVNDYLRLITGQNFTAKDFRTWHGTVTAAGALYKSGVAETETEAKKHVTAAIILTAQHLGNTPAICRKSYIHPGIIEAYSEGLLSPIWERVLKQEGVREHPGLFPDEVAALAVLQEQLDQAAAERPVTS